MPMLQIFPDELLHSYVLRVIISHGLANRPEDIKGIISKTGFMKADLALTEQQYNVFSVFPVATLMELLENHMPVKCLYPKLSNPKSLPAKCGRTFFHRQTEVIEDFEIGNIGYHKNGYNLRYCPECIREQIQLYGSGWFRFDWLFVSKCNIHDSDFISIRQRVCSCDFNILDKVISALSGVCVRCKTEVKCPPKITEPTEIGSHLPRYFYPSFLKRYSEDIDMHISYCFILSFGIWARKFYLALDGNQHVSFNPLIFRNIERLIDINRDPKSVRTPILLSLIDGLERNLNDHFCDFLDKHTEILKIDCSDCVPAEIFVDFKVAKDRDCATCKVRPGLCPLKA